MSKHPSPRGGTSQHRHTGAPDRLSPRGTSGGAFIMSTDAKQMLRAIRALIDEDCVYRGSDQAAAAAAGMSIEAASRVLNALCRRGLIKLRREKRPDAR